MNTRGFTLIELLIVVGIIAILAGVVFSVLNPQKRFQDSRDAIRADHVNSIVSAIKLHQVDAGGTILAVIAALENDEVYMIVDGGGSDAMSSGGDDNNTYCDTNVTNNVTDVVDLDELVTDGYLGEIPVSPKGNVTWDSGGLAGNEGTGYTLSYNGASGVVTVRACESENTTEIAASR